MWGSRKGENRVEEAEVWWRGGAPWKVLSGRAGVRIKVLARRVCQSRFNVPFLTGLR